MTNPSEAETRREVPAQQTPPAVLAFLGVALVFALGVTAFVAFRRHQSALFFIALASCSMSFLLGRSLPTHRR